VALVSVGENLDLSAPSGRFVATILQAFAAMEAAMISTRTREAVAYMAREGRHRGGLAAFGWKSAERDDGPGYVLRLDPVNAAVVREAVDRTIAGEPSDRSCRSSTPKVSRHQKVRAGPMTACGSSSAGRSSAVCRSTRASWCMALTDYPSVPTSRC